MRRTSIVVVGVALGLLLLAGGGILRAAPTEQPPTTVVLTGDPVRDRIIRTQERLVAVPGDWRSWAALAVLYLERSRTTGDPTWYTKAEGAVQRSFEVRPEGNADASTAAGALANSRHDFAAARRYALDAIAVNPYSAQAYAVLGDAETQLG